MYSKTAPGPSSRPSSDTLAGLSRERRTVGTGRRFVPDSLQNESDSGIRRIYDGHSRLPSNLNVIGNRGRGHRGRGMPTSSSRNWSRPQQPSKRSSFTANRQFRTLDDGHDSDSEQGFLVQSSASSTTKNAASYESRRTARGVSSIYGEVIHRIHSGAASSAARDVLHDSGSAQRTARKRALQRTRPTVNSNHPLYWNGGVLATSDAADDEEDGDDAVFVRENVVR